jgi:hypothetical protein
MVKIIPCSPKSSRFSFFLQLSWIDERNVVLGQLPLGGRDLTKLSQLLWGERDLHLPKDKMGSRIS